MPNILTQLTVVIFGPSETVGLPTLAQLQALLNPNGDQTISYARLVDANGNVVVDAVAAAAGP